jgi:hypothetical protein
LIKRIRLATGKSGLGAAGFAAAWREAVAAVASAPQPARPARITVSTALRDVAPGQKYDGVGIEWFTDAEHLLRFESWLGGVRGELPGRLLEVAVDVDASPVVVADERVNRGAGYLEARWQGGGPKIKQLAIATRAAGLTLQQFLDLWRGRAGKIGAKPIPEAYRGLAYVQNHPRVLPGADWAYDAVNEVYFDDTGSLLARIDYFAKELNDAEDDLVGANWFLAVQEEPIAVDG